MDVIAHWSEFNLAMVGATAALAGLLIVAASVNIAQIIAATSLTARLAGGIASLVLALSVSALGLVPEIDPRAYGLTTLALALVSALFQIDAARRIFQNRAPENRLRLVKAVVGFVPTGLYAIGGIILITGGSGLLLLAVGGVTAIVVAVVVSWIVLVEVLR